MADSEPTAQTEIVVYDERRLKYLEFVEMVVAYAAVCCRSLYEFAKANAGPLQSGVQTIEDTVRTVLGPVWEKFQDVPFELLHYIDREVDEYVHDLERHMPSLVKQISGQTRAIAVEAHRAGAVDAMMGFARSVFETCEPVAKKLYVRYEPVAEQYAIWAWRHLSQLPMFPEVAHMVVPMAAYWVERYNEGVCYGTEKGYAAASYMPLIPIDRIAKIFEEAERGQEVVPVNGDVGLAQ
ncbi:stress-related protein [Punica granatum]|uniref:Uncharacterized protein n=2 Tax=Punica granatum TaxID=22663 RepID=A0A2I0K2N5_PUNGR|nr:stress-related protein [Punica granatum]PKI62809.1 hypothetical protein CRG98_016760 [Punica granatum]